MQKFAAVALVGLLAFFPVFNQVKDTALEALTDADHQAKWKSFFKNWDDIPEDEKLEYWDGRNKPPAGDGEFDRDRIDDDAKFDNPPPQPSQGDRDGDGVPDDEDKDPDDPENDERRPYRVVVEELWIFNGSSTQAAKAEFQIPEDASRQGRDYDALFANASYEGFTGRFTFTLRVGGDVAWSFDEGSPNDLAVREDGGDDKQVDGVGTSRVTMQYDYAPQVGAPDSFSVRISGSYKVYEDGGDEEA